MDEVAEVRESASEVSTANILHKFASAENEMFLRGFIEQMQLFKDSNKYNFRQTFIGMISSILEDFSSLPKTQA